MPQKDVVKKTSVSKLTKEKHVRIIKHFQPVNNKQHLNCELPEVDNDVDVQEYLKTLTTNKRFFYQERKPKNVKETYSKNEKICKNIVIPRKKNKRVPNKIEIEPFCKPQSLIELTNHQIIEKPKPFLTKKSKSSSLNIKQPEQISNDRNNRKNTRVSSTDRNNRKNILISSSSPDFNETHVTNLKREISQNRCKTAGPWLDTKLYLMHKNEIHNEKVKHLRKEISKLINIDLDERKSHVTELKTEIAEFKKNNCIAVYNVETNTGPDLDSEKDIKSDATSKSSTTTAEETDKHDVEYEDSIEIESVEVKTTTTLTEEEIAEQEINSTDLTTMENGEDDEYENPTCRKLCMLDDGNMADPGLYNANDITDHEDFIKAKILEANMLIDRVKDTLTDIKNKSKRDSQDRDAYGNAIPDSVDIPQIQICYEPQVICCNVQEPARPKTRRPMSCNKKADIEDKFKNTVCEKLEPTESLEVLQTKLNTIIEQAESDSMSGSEGKDNEELKVASDVEIKEEPIPQQTSAVQVMPDVASTGIQNTPNEMKTATTQTDKPQKKFCLDTNCVVTIPSATPKLCKMEKLNIQNLPPIDIKRQLAVQRVLKFYIDSEGKTHLLPQSKAKNNRFYEVVHPPPPNNLKIRFEKRMSGYLNSTSSEISVLMTQKNPSILAHSSKSPTAKLQSSVSDGELITLRKQQLKESMKAKVPADKLESLSKELVLRSFLIYDNPNIHDPGETKLPVNVSSIDTFVYKTYINPDGLPNASSLCNNRIMNLITPETLQKISQHKPMSSRNQASTAESRRLTSSVTPRTDNSIAVSTILPKKAITVESSINQMPSKKNEPINLYDLGLYSAKSTQVETASFKSSMGSAVKEIKSEEPKSEEPKSEKLSVSSDYNKEDSDVSYDKISITVSYSTEETVSSDSTSNCEKEGASDFIQIYERELQTVEPLHPTNKVPEVSRGSQETFHMLKEKFAKGYKEEDNLMDEASFQSISLESAIPEFITGLTESTTTDLKKILPHIRKNVTGSKNNLSHGETSIKHSSSKKLLNKVNTHESDLKNSSKKSSNRDYNVLSMQIHGDCIRNNSKLMDSHLKLGKNGRYKDEENLFCEDHSKLTSIPLRRRALKTIPRHSYVSKYTLDSSSCEAVSVEPSLSEGEIKCHSSASIGEVQRRPHEDQFNKIRQKIMHKNLGNDTNVIRERRTYFNHWITYYINKNANIPLLSHSSSTSST